MRLKGSYTVEAAYIISISIIVIGAFLLLAFELYSESIDFIKNTLPSDVDIVERFRLLDAGKEILSDLSGD